ncbi:hypothetical protein FBU30_005639 [Linnemannia zychae]|nr:hypothetical protein FBU30_005639 [Linnemannia zychae]
MARREKRHFQSSSPSTLSNYSSSSLVQSSPNKKSTKGGGVTFSSQSLSFLNRSAPVTTESKTAATEVTVPSSTAKPKDKFLSRRRSLPFTTQSLLSLDSKGKSSSTELPVANASASVSTTPMLLLSEKPVPNIDAKPILTTLPTTASSRDERNHGKLRASLRNRISTWASSVRQSFTAAHHHHQQQQYRSSSSDASASPKTAKKGEGMVMPLPSESHSMLSSKELSSFTLSCAPAQMSSANKETELAAERITTGIVLPLTSPKEGIDGTRTNLSSSFQLPPTQETYDGDDDKGRGDQEDDEQQEEKLTRRRHYELSHDPVKSFSTLPLERTLKVVEAPSQYPIAATEAAPSAIPAIVRTFAHPAQYIPMNTSAAGRPKHHTSFKTLTHTASSFANTIATTTIHPTTTLATTTAVVAKIGDTPLSMTSTAPIYNTSNHSSPSSPLEHSMRFRSLNESNRRKIGSGLITIFCIAAIVILILC